MFDQIAEVSIPNAFIIHPTVFKTELLAGAINYPLIMVVSRRIELLLSDYRSLVLPLN